MVRIYEASNPRLREFYLFASPLPLGEVIRLHCDRPPSDISHWRRGQGVEYQQVEADLDESDAASFISAYGRFLASRDWKPVG